MGGNRRCTGDTRAFASGSATCTRPSLSFEPSTRRPETLGTGRWQSAVRARGTASEAELEALHGTVVDFRNGKGIRVRTYLDPNEALEARRVVGIGHVAGNVEIVRRVYEVLPQAGSRPRNCSMNISVRSDGRPSRIFYGFDGLQKGLGPYWETFEGFHIEVEEVIHADEGQVVTVVRDGDHG